MYKFNMQSWIKSIIVCLIDVCLLYSIYVIVICDLSCCLCFPWTTMEISYPLTLWCYLCHFPWICICHSVWHFIYLFIFDVSNKSNHKSTCIFCLHECACIVSLCVINSLVLVHYLKGLLLSLHFPNLLWRQKEGVPCRRRLRSFWKQYISHIATLLGCQSAGVFTSTTHTTNCVSCYMHLKIEDGLMYVCNRKGQC